uniref:Hexokinase-2 n=1 Tax=Lygus hesperus TaxID=30085 RepID=A0A0A9WV27_LYGHE
MLEDTYKFTDAQKSEINSSIIAMESHRFAETVAYPGIDNGTVLSDTYKSQCTVVAQTRVTLAGYRLATILNTILPKVDMDVIEASVRKVTSTDARVNPFASLIIENLHSDLCSKSISSEVAA